MILKIDNSLKFGQQHGGFGIQILYPGTIMPNLKDTGVGTIGRIDQAKVNPGTLIPMHPHRDDEILTYLRNGMVKHSDSKGLTTIISNQKLMMMNAGARFYHEEMVLAEGGISEGLQIFIRPAQNALKPQVQFYDLPFVYSLNSWRKIAGKGEDYPLQIRSDTWIQDVRIMKEETIALPNLPAVRTSMLLYLFEGAIQLSNGERLKTGESIIIEEESLNLKALATSDVVLFMTDKRSEYAEDGMYSGNQKKRSK